MGSHGFLGPNGFWVPIRAATRSDAQKMDMSKTAKAKEKRTPAAVINYPSATLMMFRHSHPLGYLNRHYGFV